MTFTIQVSKNIGALLEEKAKGDGKDISEYVGELIQRDIDKRKRLDQILAPIRETFARQGLSEAELDEIIDGERRAIWEEKQRGNHP